MSNLDKETIANVVTVLIGETEPAGAEHIDGKRYDNLEKHIELLNVLVDDLWFLIDRKDDPRASVNKIGEKAYNTLIGLRESLGDLSDTK